MALRVYTVWFLVFLVVASIAILSYYAENDAAYSTAQLPSTRTDGTSGSSSSGSSTSARPLALVSLVSLLALLGMVTLIAAVAIKRRRIEIEDADPPAALTVQTWVQIDNGEFDVPIAAATTSAPEMPDSYQGWVGQLAPNIQLAESTMIPPDTPLSKGAAAIPQTSLVKQKMKQAAGVDFKVNFTFKAVHKVNLWIFYEAPGGLYGCFKRPFHLIAASQNWGVDWFNSGMNSAPRSPGGGPGDTKLNRKHTSNELTNRKPGG